MKDINLHSVVATTSVGGCHTRLHRLCNDLNLPQPVNEKPLNNLSYLKTCTVKNCERNLWAAAHELRKLMLVKYLTLQSVLTQAGKKDMCFVNILHTVSNISYVVYFSVKIMWAWPLTYSEQVIAYFRVVIRLLSCR